jgi:hypothetical protein
MAARGSSPVEAVTLRGSARKKRAERLRMTVQGAAFMTQ